MNSWPEPRSESKRPAFPTAIRKRYGVGRVTLDIPYFAMPGVLPNLLSLDIYSPDTGSAAVEKLFPAICMIHGGGWRRGDKAREDNGMEKARFFNSLGYVYVSINHRLSPDVQHPAHVEDIARALFWLDRNLAAHGGDKEKIHLIGHSSGAHLAALVATDERYLGFHGKGLDLIKGVILLDSGAYEVSINHALGPKLRSLYENAFGFDTDQWPDASPLAHVEPGKGIGKMLIFATDRDNALMATHEFSEALRAAGVSVAAVETGDINHAGLNQQIGEPGDGPTRLIRDFLDGKDLSTFPSRI